MICGVKFFPENKKKQYLFLGVLVFSVSGIIYVNFFLNRPPKITGGSAPLEPVVSTNQSVPSTQPPAPAKLGRKAGLLPYGSVIDMSLLDTEKFKALKVQPALIVNPEELGKADLFRQ